MYNETNKPRVLTRIISWIKAHRTRSIIFASIFVLLVASGVAFALLSQKAPEIELPQIIPKEKPKPVTYYSPLTGKKVKDEAATKQPVTAIMIENSPDARPQSGLKQSGVVYEAIAEGGITRFLTLHQQDKPKLIGPVRSLRMYYVDWLAPYNASVAHVGGSYDALKEIRNGKYRDIDQFFNAGTYWRTSDRVAPHNVYTNSNKLDELNKEKGYKTSEFDGFPRKDGKAKEKPDATNISINFSSATYNTNYQYDKKNNRYKRLMGGVPHTDREEGQITPDVVVAMKTDMKAIMRDGYREDIRTTGRGEAIIFQNGTAEEVTWNKVKRSTQLFFTNKEGKEVKLNRGQTWIAAVPNGKGDVSWQ